MARRRAEGERGFIITLELVLIFTILGIGLLVGIMAIRNALFVWWHKKQAHTVWVYDSTPAPDGPIVLGPARDFDEHEAPRLFFVDREFADLDPADPPPADVDPSWQGRNFRAFLGVRDDRFTSRHRIFYEGLACTGPAICIQAAGSENPDTRLVGQVVAEPTPGSPMPTDEWVDNAGGVGYLYALQQGPSYGIGRHPDAVLYPTGYPGGLYRLTPTFCDADTLLSTWESQRVGGACVARTMTALVSDLNCPPAGGSCPGGAAPECVSGPPEGCNCPEGWNRPTGGANCCPDGSISGPGTGVPPGQCRNASLFNAVPVDFFNDIVWTLPFRVNLPPDPNDFTMLDPSGVEGGPGIPTTTPYDPSGDPTYDRVPDGEASPP